MKNALHLVKQNIYVVHLKIMCPKDKKKIITKCILFLPPKKKEFFMASYIYKYNNNEKK